MTKKIRKFFNEKDEETEASTAGYAIELEFSKEGLLLRSRRYEIVRTEFVEKKQIEAEAIKAVVTVLERIEVEPGVYRHVVGLPFGSGAKAERGEGEGQWVTIQGRPVYITKPRGGPGRAGFGDTVRVGITSFKDDKGQTAKRLEKDMDELKSALEDTPAHDVTVALGTGGFEGGSEPTFVTQFRGDGEARKALARKAKEWNQDSVIVTTPVKEGGTPEGRLSFSRALDAAEIEKVNQTILAASDKLGAGIGGWTWAQGKDGPEFIANCIPEWGGNPETHIQAMRAAKEILKKSGLGSTLAEGQAEVEIWERDKGDYDRIIEG